MVSLPKYKILLIDDEDDLRETLRDRLESCSFEVIEADRGLLGIDMATRERPDLVILDLMMPAMSGYEVWREFQKRDELRSIPIIILTCKRQSNDKYWGLSMPKENFFTKPYDTVTLIKRIASLIQEREDKLSGSSSIDSEQN